MYSLSYDFIRCSFSRHPVKIDDAMSFSLTIWMAWSRYERVLYDNEMSKFALYVSLIVSQFSDHFIQAPSPRSYSSTLR